MVTAPALWAHQEAVQADLLAGHRLLLWDMGTGKTAALIKAGETAGGAGPAGRQLWVTLGMLVAQAEQEVTRFRPGALVQVVRTGKDNIWPSADVVIVSYDLMRAVPIWRQLFALRWASMVCDEGHALAHSGTVRTRAVYGARMDSKGALFRRADRVWIATGTPVLNTPDELWTHLSRLRPDLLPEGVTSVATFMDRFCVVKMKIFGPVVVGGKNLPELGNILRQCSSRLKLRDITSLPPVVMSRLPVEISDEDRAAMNATMTPGQLAEIDIVLAAIEDGDVAAWQRLQAMMLPLASTRRVTALAKAPAAVEIIRNELLGGLDRVVVFGSHIDALKHVATALAPYGSRLLIGDTTPVQRATALADFQEDGGPRVLICNTTVGGFGLNLQHASRCVMLDLPWTPAALDQAVARLHRAGQLRGVNVSLLAVARSVDARVADVLARKREIIHDIIERTS